MTPPSRSPDRRVAGYPLRGANGAAGPAGLGNDLVGGSAGFGNGLTGSDGVGATGSPDSGVTADSSGTGAIGGLPYGLVQRVQRRLASDGSVATDSAGLRAAVTEALSEDGVPLPAANLAPIVRAVGDELTGLGPLAPLLADPAVTDVLVNGPTEVWVERGGSIERAPVRFASPAAVAALVQRVVAPLGLRVDESRPWVDARLPGGQRFHAVLPPLAPDGPVITIRTFARRRLQLSDLVDLGPSMWPRRDSWKPWWSPASPSPSPARPAPARPPRSTSSPPPSRHGSAS
jgi:Type II/IV secretion system protein